MFFGFIICEGDREVRDIGGRADLTFGSSRDAEVKSGTSPRKLRKKKADLKSKGDLTIIMRLLSHDSQFV